MLISDIWLILGDDDNRVDQIGTFTVNDPAFWQIVLQSVYTLTCRAQLANELITHKTNKWKNNLLYGANGSSIDTQNATNIPFKPFAPENPH